jgi:hypothetical protein
MDCSPVTTAFARKSPSNDDRAFASRSGGQAAEALLTTQAYPCAHAGLLLDRRIEVHLLTLLLY